MSKRQYRLYETETVDENGEFKKGYKSASYVLDDGPGYVRLYISEVLSTLYGLPASCSTVLFFLLKHITYANKNSEKSMTVYLNSELKRELLQQSQLTNVQSIDNALQMLIKSRILHRIARSTYQVNPHLFGKGKWEDIYELRMTHIWNSFGHTVVTEARRQKRSAVVLSNEDKEIYERYSALEKIAKEKHMTLEELLKQLDIPNPPDWWEKMS